MDRISERSDKQRNNMEQRGAAWRICSICLHDDDDDGDDGDDDGDAPPRFVIVLDGYNAGSWPTRRSCRVLAIISAR